jgi:hypothetical protein
MIAPGAHPIGIFDESRIDRRYRRRKFGFEARTNRCDVDVEREQRIDFCFRP